MGGEQDGGWGGAHKEHEGSPPGLHGTQGTEAQEQERPSRKCINSTPKEGDEQTRSHNRHSDRTNRTPWH